MSKDPRYRNTRHYMSTYGFSPTYWRSIFKKLGYTKSSGGARAEMLLDENVYLEYLESNKVIGTLEAEQIASSI